MEKIEKWGLFEISMEGKREGNPYLDYSVRGTFTSGHETVTVDGFYDGDGIYKVRFCPSYEGEYSYRIWGSALERTYEGRFEAVTPGENNHGPVVVRKGMRLAYADGTSYFSLGTTCYAWVCQPMELQEQTLGRESFNKLRFCFFPKYYDFNREEPITYPFERGNGEGLSRELVKFIAEDTFSYPGMKKAEMDYGFNYFRPNPGHFRLFDLRIAQLCEMGIEADLILMHPYDRWGMNAMGPEACDAYLRYIVARYGAYRNVWWSLSNEFDFIRTKTPEDWERYGQLVSRSDPYRRLLSVHNGGENYDFSRPWVTHCSLQRVDFFRTTENTELFLETYKKPVVWDEICYEGNIGLGWGNISGQELVRRFWEAFLRGGHCGHGETYLDPEDVLWWSKGGVLKGESAPRLRFLLDILKETPGGYLQKGKGLFDETVGCSAEDTVGEGMIGYYDYAIHYLGIMRPSNRMVLLPEEGRYRVEVIDTWNMTIDDRGVFCGCQVIDLPAREYLAIRIQKVP